MKGLRHNGLDARHEGIARWPPPIQDIRRFSLFDFSSVFWFRANKIFTSSTPHFLSTIFPDESNSMSFSSSDTSISQLNLFMPILPGLNFIVDTIRYNRSKVAPQRLQQIRGTFRTSLHSAPVPVCVVDANLSSPFLKVSQCASKKRNPGVLVFFYFFFHVRSAWQLQMAACETPCSFASL